MANNSTQTPNVIFKRKTTSFSMIANPIIDDKNITPAAGWLYVLIQRWITFNAEDIVCSKSFIASKYTSGYRMFNRAWDELKDNGYLKMYSHPIEGWQADLLDTPEPDTPHTYYLDKAGNIKSTNIDRAEKKAAKLAAETHYPQNDSNGTHYPQNDSNGNDSNGNGGNKINTINNNSYNNNSYNNNSYNQSIYPNEPLKQSEDKSMIDRLIDEELLEEIKEQIDYDIMLNAPEYSLSVEDLNAAVEAIAILKTATAPMTFNKTSYDPSVIRSRANEIDSSHLSYVFECLRQGKEEINNIHKYLLTSFFNAPITHDGYIHNRLRAAGVI